MTNKALAIIHKIRDQYLKEHETCIMIYGATKAPHFLLVFVHDRLVLQEVAYQIVIHKVEATLYLDKKAIWPPMSLWVNSYSFRSSKQAQLKVDTILSFYFEEKRFWRHDPKKVVKYYCIQIKYTWEYTLATWEEEEVYYGAQTYD
jgi:hypothetical protein